MRISNTIHCLQCKTRFEQDRPYVGTYCKDCRLNGSDDE